MAYIKIDSEKCIGCGVCASVCPVQLYSASGTKARIVGEKSSCVLCRACENMCPVNAIFVEEEI